jgi:hypothetical protein
VYRPRFEVIDERPATHTVRPSQEPLTVELLRTVETGKAVRCEVNGYQRRSLVHALRHRITNHDPELKLCTHKADHGVLVLWVERKR